MKLSVANALTMNVNLCFNKFVILEYENDKLLNFTYKIFSYYNCHYCLNVPLFKIALVYKCLRRSKLSKLLLTSMFCFLTNDSSK